MEGWRERAEASDRPHPLLGLVESDSNGFFNPWNAAYMNQRMDDGVRSRVDVRRAPRDFPDQVRGNACAERSFSLAALQHVRFRGSVQPSNKRVPTVAAAEEKRNAAISSKLDWRSLVLSNYSCSHIE